MSPRARCPRYSRQDPALPALVYRNTTSVRVILTFKHGKQIVQGPYAGWSTASSRIWDRSHQERFLGAEHGRDSRRRLRRYATQISFCWAQHAVLILG